MLFDPRDKEKADRLSRYQAYGREGAFARTASAFLHWLASQYASRRRDLHEQALAFRSDLFLERSEHARTATTLAELLAALEIFFDFLLDIRLIDQNGFERLWELAHDGLYSTQDQQTRDQAEEDPAGRYLSLVATALGTGCAHLVYLVDKEEPGDALGDPRLWGYEVRTTRVEKAKANETSDDEENGSESEEHTEHVKRGRQIGWKLYDNLFIDPQASLAVVNALAEASGEHPIPLRHKALGKRLAERGFLANEGKDRNTARIPIDGVKRDVFHIMTWRLIEFHRSDEDWAAVRDEEALLASERYVAEQRARDAIRQQARQRAHDFMQRSFAELLRPS